MGTSEIFGDLIWNDPVIKVSHKLVKRNMYHFVKMKESQDERNMFIVKCKLCTLL